MAVDYQPQLTSSQDLDISSEERLSDVSIPIPPIKTQVLGEAIELGKTELNAMAKILGHVTIDLSAVLMYKDYAIQVSAVVEIKVREGALINKVRESNKNVNKMKK